MAKTKTSKTDGDALVLRAPAESRYADQLEALRQHQTDTPPASWKLSPRSVLAYVVGAKKPITRCVTDVQDALVSILSDKAIAVPELPDANMIWAKPGFNVIATANTRDQGVNELSAALKRRFNYVYIPAELSLFEYVTAGVRAVQEAAKEHIKEILPTTNPFIKGFQQGTTIFQQIETLGSASDLAELELLAVLPEGALDEKEALERLVASLTSNLAESALTAQEELTRTLLELGELADLVTGFDRDGYNEALAGAAQLRESYRQVREESFGPGVLPGPPDDEWQRFVAAARIDPATILPAERTTSPHPTTPQMVISVSTADSLSTKLQWI